MPLFEVAILENPTKKALEEGTGKERLVFGPKCVIAKDQQAAAINAVLSDPAVLADVDKERLSILVRPFA